MAKYLIINADDFGMSAVFNSVILDLIKQNLISSTTVMVDRVTQNQQIQFQELSNLSKNQNLSIGLHLEFKNSHYHQQIKSQLQKFKSILGFYPSHLDIHKPEDFLESIASVTEFCRKNNLPLRNHGAVHQKEVKTTFKPAFYGTVDNFEKIKKWILTLEDGKYYEILFHPGKFDSDCDSSLNKERETDIEHIKKMNKYLDENNICVVSYLDLANSNIF